MAETLTVPRRKKEDADKPPRIDTACKIDAELVRVAKSVAGFRGITLAEYLSEALRPIVTRDWEQMRLPKQK